MTRLLTALLVVFAAASPALAQKADPPRLRSAVTVTGDVVRIGDLVENAGSLADVAAYRAPDLGTTGSVSAAEVLEVLRAHDVVLVDTAGVKNIEVTRASRVITRDDIEQRIMRAYAGRYGLGDPDRFAVTFDREPRTLYVEPQDDLDLVSAAYDPRTTRFDITLRMRGAAEAYMRYTGTLVEMVPAVTLNRPVNVGEIIKSSDLTLEKRPKHEVGGDAVKTLAEAAGLSARQSLRAGVPLKRTDLTRPDVVKRDDFVTLVYEVPGIMLTVRGKALDNGAVGDIISVSNLQSKRPVQGIVDGPGRVTITTSATPIATAGSAPAAASPRNE